MPCSKEFRAWSSRGRANRKRFLNDFDAKYYRRAAKNGANVARNGENGGIDVIGDGRVRSSAATGGRLSEFGVDDGGGDNGRGIKPLVSSTIPTIAQFRPSPGHIRQIQARHIFNHRPQNGQISIK